MMIIILVIISLISYNYGLYCLFREAFKIHKDNNILTDEYKSVHLSLIFYLIAIFTVLISWMFFRETPEYAIKTHLIKEQGWSFLLLSCLVMTSLSRYFRKLRTGENLLLDYEVEIKRNLNWGFSRNKSFEKISNKFIDSIGELNKDVFYIFGSDIDSNISKKLKNGEKLDFGNHSYLEKVGDKEEHNYIYHNKKPLVFGLHIHLHYKEIVTPLKNDILFYIYRINRMEEIKIKVGETYVIPKGVKHAAIFSKENSIELKWT